MMLSYKSGTPSKTLEADILHISKLKYTKTQSLRWRYCCFTAVNLFSLPPVAYFRSYFTSLSDYTGMKSAWFDMTCACTEQFWKAAWETLKGVTVGDGGRVHCLCSFSSLNQVFVYAWMEGTQRCQLVMQQKSARLDQSESLSHSPRPFCYITNMPFTKQLASRHMALNQRRGHILTSTSRKTSNYSNWRKTTRQRQS